jgi:hypothetical protein
MPEQPENLILEFLRRIDRKVDGLLRVHVVAVESHSDSLHLSDTQKNSEIERIKDRMDRVERRLELSDT